MNWKNKQTPPKNHLIRCWRYLLQNPTYLFDKSLGEIKDTKDIPKYYKSNTQQAYSQHQTKGEKLKQNPLKSEARQDCILSPYPYNTVFEILARTISQQK